MPLLQTRFRAAAVATLWLLPVLAAQPAPATDDPQLAASQAAIGRVVGDHALIDADGRPRSFAELRGRPVVLSLVYTSCYAICSGLTVNLREVVKLARQALGPGSFTVLTVGFDTPNDTPERMRLYARERGVATPEWIFASADAATMERLMRDVGFSYRASSKGFDHIIQTTVIDPGGRVALQVYGQDFRPPVLVEPLKQLIRGQALERGSLSDLVRSVKLLCTIYDPASGKYRFDPSLIMEIVAGVLALGMVGVAIVLSWRNVH